MARKGRGASGGPRGRRRSRPRRRRVWRRPCGSSVNQVGNRTDACGRGRLPEDAAGGGAGGERGWEVGPQWEAKNGMEKCPLASSPRLRVGDRREDARKAQAPWECEKKVLLRDRGLGEGGARQKGSSEIAPWGVGPLAVLRAAQGSAAFGLEPQQEKVPGASLPHGWRRGGEEAQRSLQLELPPAPGRSGRCSPGSWRPIPGTDRLQQAVASEPRGARTAKPPPSAPFRGRRAQGLCLFQVQSCALRGSLSSLGSCKKQRAKINSGQPCRLSKSGS